MSIIWSWTYFYNLHWNNYLYFKGLLYIWEEMIMMTLLHGRSRECRIHMKNPAQTGNGCIRLNDWKVDQVTFAEYSCPIRLRGVYLNVAVEKRNNSGVKRYNWVSERITNKRKRLRRSGEGEKGRYLPWSKEAEGEYIFWMKQVPVTCGLSDLLLLAVGSLVVFTLREYILKVHILVSSEHMDRDRD
jgi:hypothetical protein